MTIVILTVNLTHLKQKNKVATLDFWNIDGNTIANIMQGVGAPKDAGHQYHERKLREFVDSIILAKLPSRYNSYRVESWEFRDHADKKHNEAMAAVAPSESKSFPRHIPPKRPFRFPSLSPASRPYSALAILGV
jgi:hypothetical protein